MTGLTRYATAGTSYRHQETGSDFSINSYFVSLSYPILNSSTGIPWSGIALSLHNDQSAGIFKVQEAALGYAVHVRVGRYQTLSFGAKALFQSRRLGYDGFFTGSQYVTDRGFDLNLGNGENFTELRNSFKTFSAGLYWQQVDKKGRVLHHFGASMFDINKPVDSFLGSQSQLSSTFIVNAGFQSYSSGGFNVYPEGLLTVIGNAPMFNGGFRLQKELNVSARKASDLLDVIVKYAVRRSGIVGVQLHRENISIGLSYDFPMFVRNPGNTGAFEFGLELRRLVPTRAQKIVAKRKKAAEEKQALARKTPPKEEKKEVAKEEIKEDEQQEIPVAAVEVDTVKSVETNALAKAGGMKQDPMIIEHVTLHFAFEFNSTDVDEPTEKFIEELSETLNQDENLKLTIEGHTDNIGSDKFNLRLSQKRAETIKSMLVKKGISADRLQTEGKGMHEPLNDNLTDADRAKNRRVEITVYY